MIDLTKGSIRASISEILFPVERLIVDWRKRKIKSCYTFLPTLPLAFLSNTYLHQLPQKPLNQPCFFTHIHCTCHILLNQELGAVLIGSLESAYLEECRESVFLCYFLSIYKKDIEDHRKYLSCHLSAFNNTLVKF